MDMRKELQNTKKLLIVKESLVDYAGPVFVFGNIDNFINKDNLTIISATMPREEFVILNEHIPQWVNEVKSKSDYKYNFLLIKDMDKVSIERQEILLDILEENQISTEDLPDNLRIILNSEKKCDINTKIRDIVECYEV